MKKNFDETKYYVFLADYNGWDDLDNPYYEDAYKICDTYDEAMDEIGYAFYALLDEDECAYIYHNNKCVYEAN